MGCQTPHHYDLDEHTWHSPDPQQCLSCSPSIQPGEKHTHIQTIPTLRLRLYTRLSRSTRNQVGPRHNYEDTAKEVILWVAIIYRHLLSTQNGFPELVAETKLVKMAWEKADMESGTSLVLTLEIAKIVSPVPTILQYTSSLLFIRSRPVDCKLMAKPKRKRDYLLKLYMVLRVAIARRQLLTIKSLQRNWKERRVSFIK